MLAKFYFEETLVLLVGLEINASMSLFCENLFFIRLGSIAKGYELSVEVCLFETIIITVEISHTIEVN